jgi:hypothetical protein
VARNLHVETKPTVLEVYVDDPKFHNKLLEQLFLTPEADADESKELEILTVRLCSRDVLPGYAMISLGLVLIRAEDGVSFKRVGLPSTVTSTADVKT